LFPQTTWELCVSAVVLNLLPESCAYQQLCWTCYLRAVRISSCAVLATWELFVSAVVLYLLPESCAYQQLCCTCYLRDVPISSLLYLLLESCAYQQLCWTCYLRAVRISSCAVLATWELCLSAVLLYLLRSLALQERAYIYFRIFMLPSETFTALLTEQSTR
jgi:hypothetical protein